MASERRPRGAESGEPTFGLGKSILFSAILVSLVFILAETGVRTYAYYLRDDVEHFDAAAGTFTLLPGTYRNGVQINSDGFVGPELAEPGPDLWRIYALGDSCTYGGGNPISIYPTRLQRMLREYGPDGMRYEVVNAGISGLNSELALRRLQAKGPAIDPDVVTIYIGWNDLMKFDPVSQQKDTGWSTATRALDSLWLAKGLRKLMFFYVRPWLRPPATGPESRTGRFADFVPGVYETNLRRIVATAREMGATPVIVTLPTVVRSDMDAADLRRARVVFPYFPSAYAVGDLLDLIAAHNRAIRRVAIEENVPLADAAKVFAREPDPYPFFTDTMHLQFAGHELIAVTLYETLSRAGLTASAPES
jgi:lysophospholipase L1-like esterase